MRCDCLIEGKSLRSIKSKSPKAHKTATQCCACKLHFVHDIAMEEDAQIWDSQVMFLMAQIRQNWVRTNKVCITKYRENMK